jgi:hypothetical protein
MTNWCLGWVFGSNLPYALFSVFFMFTCSYWIISASICDTILVRPMTELNPMDGPKGKVDLIPTVKDAQETFADQPLVDQTQKTFANQPSVGQTNPINQSDLANPWTPTGPIMWASQATTRSSQVHSRRYAHWRRTDRTSCSIQPTERSSCRRVTQEGAREDIQRCFLVEYY